MCKKAEAAGTSHASIIHIPYPSQTFHLSNSVTGSLDLLDKNAVGRFPESCWLYSTVHCLDCPANHHPYVGIDGLTSSACPTELWVRECEPASLQYHGDLPRPERMSCRLRLSVHWNQENLLGKTVTYVIRLDRRLGTPCW